jgi:hypothetical protein
MRMTILNEEEIDRLYGIPRFTQEARAAIENSLHWVLDVTFRDHGSFLRWLS